MSDLRTSRDRDAALHAQIERDGGISLTVLVGNRDHAASLHRLIASGRVGYHGDGWIALGISPVSTLRTLGAHGLSVGDALNFHLPPQPWHIRLWRWMTFYRAPVGIVSEVTGDSTITVAYPPPPSLRDILRDWA